MVDLKSQYIKIKDEIDTGIFDVINETSFIKGNAVSLFQSELEKFLDVKHVVPCANGTDALQIALMSLGLQAGDEVITASFSYVATAEVLVLLGLKPVFVDVNPKTFLIDPECIEYAITNKTKVILPVHLFGQCADMEKILQIANRYNLFVIEDNAQAIGSSYTFKNGKKKKSGCIGDIGCTSFFPSKNLGCFGDGGAIYTNNDELAKKLRMIANHGQSKRYYHDIVGVNSRLDSIQAAILRVKLSNLNEYTRLRNVAASYYDDYFKNSNYVTIPNRVSNSTHVFHQYTLIINNFIDRDEFKSYLKEQGIPSMVYYPVPIHKQKAYEDIDYLDGHLPVTDFLCNHVISLPMHTELDTNQLYYICNTINFYFNKKK